jgi:YggT family protein
VQQSYSPIYQILDQITAPVLNPIRRIIPPIGGFDFTPLIALIGLQALMILIP